MIDKNLKRDQFSFIKSGFDIIKKIITLEMIMEIWNCEWNTNHLFSLDDRYMQLRVNRLKSFNVFEMLQLLKIILKQLRLKFKYLISLKWYF